VVLRLDSPNLVKIICFFVALILELRLTLFLGPPPQTQANGPLPFAENFDTFSGSGFDPNPGAGQLDSDIWIVTGFSDGSMAFGDTQTAGDFARGSSPGGVTTGGIYAFDVGGGNNILGIQPGGRDFTPGDIILRLQNNTGLALGQLNVSYDLWYLNNADRANALNFSHSPDGTTYTSVVTLDFTTPQASDALGWQSTSRATALVGLNIAHGSFFYLKWTGADVSGQANRDEYGLDNVRVAVPAGDSPPFVTTTMPPNRATDVAANTTITIQFNEVVTITANTFALECPTGTAIAFKAVPAPPGNAGSFMLTPNANLPHGRTCIVTVNRDEVIDQDGTPDKMIANHAFTFTTAVPAGDWIINEIHADPDGTNGDANGDGTVSGSQDEFVEIVNNSGGTVDISGWTLSDNNSVRHTFSGGTMMPDQCAIVVFGGGTPSGRFGDALVQTAGSLGLNNGGDTVTFKNEAGLAQASYSYGTEGGDNQSLTRDPDITGVDPLVKHSTATGSGGRLFSPGTPINGLLFSGCSPPRVTATTPAGGTTDVEINTTVNIQFSEVVTTTANTFALECPAATAMAYSTAPAPPGQSNSFTLIPNAILPYSTTCTVTVNRQEVTDQDDAPENMAANYVFTFTTAAAVEPIFISEFLYDGTTPATQGDEFVELCNPNAGAVDLTGYKVGDEESSGGSEGMVEIPAGTLLAPDACLIVAKNAADFQTRFGLTPTFEVGGLQKYTRWGKGSWSLANTGDELLVLGPGDQILDSVAYRHGDYAALGLEGEASAPAPYSLQRVWSIDTNSMPHDFIRKEPNPGRLTLAPTPPAGPPAPAMLPGGMKAYWGHLHAHTTYSDGAGPPHYALALARAAGLHFYAVTDHGWQSNSAWWASTFNQTGQATVPGQFVALRGVEWSHGSSGHINVFNSNTLLQHTDPQYDTLAEFYTWLAANPSAIAQFNHPDLSFGGTFDEFAFNPAASPMVFMQEIGNNAQRYSTYEPAFVQANAVGWQVAPTNNHDAHAATWGTGHIPRTGIVAPALTEADLLAAMRARRIFATEDNNLALALRVDGVWMGSVLTAAGTFPLTVDVVDPDPEPLSLFVYDSNLLLATVPMTSSTGQWTTSVSVLPGHYYWVKAVQADGDTAYSAPIWIEGQAAIGALVINELLPAPSNIDWDGDGTANRDDEWVELFNPLSRTVGLGGWRLGDSSGLTYNIPLTVSIPAGGFTTFYKRQTGLVLNNSGDTLTLIHPNGRGIDSFTYTKSPGSDETWCRLPDAGATWSENCLPTPNAPNAERPPAETDLQRLGPG
jgi:hypothetical protein